MPAGTPTARKKKASKPANKKKNASKKMFARVLLQDHHCHHRTTTITKKTKVVVTRKTMAPAKKSAAKKVSEKKTIPKKMDGNLQAGKTGVYVLELNDGCVYVGKSSNVARRVQQHVQGNGFFRWADFACLFHSCTIYTQNRESATLLNFVILMCKKNSRSNHLYFEFFTHLGHL